ncbi:acetyl-CoA synthetase-like protein [Gymnopus androsaceus JB14]|uniref:Acetyl-CoA synthetase-like protein n=1 Tax=Gymnopus androsaceus JB14 TaxID=1447944 RepID=A0A6A4GHA4_9AGAR|nr:acetyl-CoA synthetase-like protein [Gymnopus androsaceus JB14]
MKMPTQNISTLLSPEDMQLLSWGSPGDHRTSAEPRLSTIHKYIWEAAHRRPNAIALHWWSGKSDEEIQLSYAQLEKRVDALARRLAHIDVKRGDIVLAFFEKGIQMIVGILGILKTGAAYVPLDINHPPERIRAISSLTCPKLCLTTSSLSSAVASHLPHVQIVSLDSANESWEQYLPPFQPKCEATGEDLCYIMYTSGSTGTPKGVMVQHSAVVASVIDGPEANQILRSEGSEGKLRTLGLSNYAFDVSIWDIFLTLTSGGTLCLAPTDLMLNELTHVLNRMKITFLETTPTLLVLVDPAEVPTLNTIYSTGEPLSFHLRNRFLSVKNVGREIRFGNGGAPTETTVMSIFTLLDSSPANSDSRIFGKPFGWNRAYVLDNNEKLCPPGTVGDLWIGGPQVTKGYLGREDLTKAAYCEDIFFAGTMYNTGDLCSWMTDGSGRLLHHGRKDGQVKIRGQRVEVGEVESAIRECEGGSMRDVFVCKIITDVGTELLVALLVSNKTAFEEASLMKALHAKLPSYMVPSAAINLSAFPITPNGKQNNRALKDLAQIHIKERLELSISHNRQAYDTETYLLSSLEKAVISVWSACLDIGESAVPMDSNFLSCGGDSISAIGATIALRKHGFHLSFADFLHLGTVREQIHALSNMCFDTNHSMHDISYRAFELIDPSLKEDILIDCIGHGYQEEDIEDAYLCTPLVSGLISLSVNHPHAYTAHFAFRKDNGYNLAHLKAAWLLVLQRHPILRTAGLVTCKGIAQFIVSSECASCMMWTDAQFQTQVECDHAAELHIHNSPGFALGVIPICIALFEGPESSILTWQMHHSQYDGWCFPQILRDLHTAYAISEGHSSIQWSSPTSPYPLFVRWLSQQDTSESLKWWTSELQDIAALSWPENVLPNDEVPLTDGLSVRSWVCGEALALACAKHGITVSSFVRAALGILLSMYANTNDVVYGVVASGRSGDLKGVESIVGPCIVTLPCRMKINPDDLLFSLLNDVQINSIKSSAHHNVGLPEILKSNPSTSLNVLLTVENISGLFNNTDELLGDYLKGHHLEMNYALAVTIFPSPDGHELRCQFEWDSRLLSTSDIDYFSTHLIHAFQKILDSGPSTTIGHLNILSSAEETFLKAIGTGSKPDITFTGYSSFPELLDHISHQFPCGVAIEHVNGAAMTYKELSERSNQVATGLRSKGVGPEVMVPVLFDKDSSQIDTIVAFVSIMKAGGAFVPLDASWPVDRITACVQQTNCGFLICDAATPDVAHVIDTSIIALDEILHDQNSLAPSDVQLQPEALAYVMFTSGSTGKPKGVLIEHGNIMAYIANGHTIFPLKDVKRMLHFSPYTFDQGLADIFLTVSVGATLILADMTDMISDMSAILTSSKVDYALMTPAVAQMINFDVEYPHLKTLVVGGEKCPRQLSEAWRTRVKFIDAYGPTEATVHCVSSNHTISFQGPGVIGRPLGSCKAYILKELNLVPVGVIGELCIAGPQLARGYLDASETTAEVFVPNPFSSGERLYRTGDLARWTANGNIEYLGRMDGGYVKLNGLRVDLGEVETALTSVKEIHGVVEVVKYEGRSRLLAFLSRHTLVGGSARVEAMPELYTYAPIVHNLRGACRRALPSYMIPDMWLVLNCIPQAASNKIDRRQLRILFQKLESSPGDLQYIAHVLNSTDNAIDPEDAFEQIIANIWMELLGLKEVTVHDDFFTIGGNSILTVVCLGRFKAMGWAISLKEFHEARTISRLAEIIKLSARDCTSNTISNANVGGLVVQIHSVELDEERSKSPIWFIHGGGGFISPHYGLLDPLGREVCGISNPSTDSESLSQNYPTIDSFTEHYLSLIPMDRSIYLAGWSSGGTLALAMAAARVKSGLPIKGVILIDSSNTLGWKIKFRTTFNSMKGAHLRHIRPLLETAEQPYCPVPVLLIRSERPFTINGKPLNEYPPLLHGQTEDARLLHNFYDMEKMPNCKIVTIPGSDHISLMSNVLHRSQLCDHIRDWCT